MSDFSEIDPRLLSMGMFASSVAHEINTPLFYLEGNLAFIQQEFEKEEPFTPERLADLKNMVGDAAHGAKQLRMIVNDLKVFSSPIPKQPERVALEEVFEITARLAHHTIKESDVELRMQEDGLPHVMGSPGILGMLLGNLIINAFQAKANTITVTAAKESDKVIVAVHDDGCGIAADQLEKIFNMFYTARPDKGGTGIGLALCKSLADLLSAEIRVESKLGTGTTMFVELQSA